MSQKRDDSLFGKLFQTVDAVFEQFDNTMTEIFGPGKGRSKRHKKKPQPDVRITIKLDQLATLSSQPLTYYVPGKDLEIEVCLKN